MTQDAPHLVDHSTLSPSSWWSSLILHLFENPWFYLRRDYCPSLMGSKGIKADGWERPVQFMLCSNLGYGKRDVVEHVEPAHEVFVGGGDKCCRHGCWRSTLMQHKVTHAG